MYNESFDLNFIKVEIKVINEQNKTRNKRLRVTVALLLSNVVEHSNNKDCLIAKKLLLIITTLFLL